MEFPSGTELVADVTDNDVSAGPVTVSESDPLIEPTVAVITDEPLALPVTFPGEVIAAMPGAEELHVATFVTSLVVESL